VNEYRSVLERAGSNFAPLDLELESVLRRRDRKRRNQRIGAGALAIILALVSFAALIRTFRTVERPADEPTPVPTPSGIFADVGGWIVYGNDDVKQGPLGIWAVDPTRPNDPEARIQLSDRPGEPLAWSSGGSKLLIRRTRDPGCPRQGCAGPLWATLFVLKADGTETRVVTTDPKVGGGPWLDRRGWIAGGSFSPDGSQVVFAASVERVNGIYTVDANGGTPRLILAAPYVYNPAFSPDGTQIAYLDLNMQTPSLRVVNADGTGVRLLHDVCDPSQRASGPAWSPDGTHIAYSCESSIWVVSADGSGITRMPGGRSPYWSPDGSRIAFELPQSRGRGLAIADVDGTNVQTFGHGGHAGPWNPLLPAMPGEPNPAATGSGLAAPFVYAIAVLGAVGILVIAWRARRRIAQDD
jgi:WD40-like Beta Propeller Repeat